MKLSIIVILLFGSYQCFSQEVDLLEVDTIFADPEVPASFPGGLIGWGNYLKKSMKYPPQAQRMGIQGRVFIEFIVEKSGELSDIKISRGIGAGCDQEAIRVLRDGPKWIPGEVNGVAIRQKMIMNITFQIK